MQRTSYTLRHRMMLAAFSSALAVHVMGAGVFRLWMSSDPDSVIPPWTETFPVLSSVGWDIGYAPHCIPGPYYQQGRPVPAREPKEFHTQMIPAPAPLDTLEVLRLAQFDTAECFPPWSDSSAVLENISFSLDDSELFP